MQGKNDVKQQNNIITVMTVRCLQKLVKFIKFSFITTAWSQEEITCFGFAR